MQRSPSALAEAQRELASQIDQVRFAQFLLFRQADQLKEHAHAKGVSLIGDLPFFVSPDSSDVWANPELFLLDEQHRPQFVAGVPPDYFSAQGQLWGNPVYNWDAAAFDWVSVVHRSGACSAGSRRCDSPGSLPWVRGCVARSSRSANGSDRAVGGGSGASFFQAVQTELGQLPFIAEDLGLITADVQVLRDQFRLPGMRVLQFAFDGHADNPYLPHNFVHNTVAYTGTHDNATTRQWYEELPDYQRQNFWNYLQRAPGTSADAAPELMRMAWSSPAALAIAPLQDLLNLGSEARMNVPGHADGNWRWRVREDRLSSDAFQWLGDLTESSNRTVSPATSVRAQVDRGRATLKSRS